MKAKSKARIAAFMVAALITASSVAMPAKAGGNAPSQNKTEYINTKLSLKKAKRVANSTVTQSAANSLTYQSNWIKKEKAKFPTGKYWNGGNPDSYTSIPCPLHIGNTCSRCITITCKNLFRNGYDHNNFLSEWHPHQCAGYAAKLASDYFVGCNIWTLQTYTPGFQFRVGDQVCIGGNHHMVFVTGVRSDGIVISDCNSDGTCIIRWDFYAPIRNNQFKSGSTYYSIDYIIRPAMSGDIDGDSIITSKDVSAIRKILDYSFKYSFHDTLYNTVVKEAADVNNDGKITEADYYLASGYVSAGYIKSGRYLTDLGKWVI